MTRLSFILLMLFLPDVLTAQEALFLAPDLYAPRRTSVVDHAAAQALTEQAQQAADQGQVSRALQLATRALQQDPGNATCRQVLGYQSVDGQWLTAYQQKQIARGFVWDHRFGWLKAEDLPRYEAGERRQGRRWFSAADDAAQHATIATGWQVRTDHFQVTTNHSLEAAARLAAELEQLFQVWRQLFAGYYLGEKEVRGRFVGTRRARVQARPFNVVYHRDKEGYVAALRRLQPRIAETLGIYFDDLREAHFYADPEAHPAVQRATLYHEAVHQLFQESKRSKINVGEQHHFWAVESAATYFETLKEASQGTFTIGDPTAGRLPAARNRYRDEDYFTPLEEMASLGRRELQRREDLGPLYGQLAALGTFLMHADQGQRREAFVRFLRNLYAHRASEDSLWRELGQSPSDVQADFRRWLAQGS